MTSVSTSPEKTSPVASHPPKGASFAVALIFLLSGATALVYEVVWTRQLTTHFGSSLYAVSTVLSAFMGGLALGSYLLGKRADRMRRPLMVYGFVEMAIGATALAFPWLLRGTHPIIDSIYSTEGDNSFLLFSLIRFVTVFILLLIPTTLMGATLPILSKAITRNLHEIGHRVGGLYALNTAGAVIGVFAAGFFLLEHLGIFKTTLAAVVVDFIIGGLSVYLGMRYFRSEAVVQDAPKAEVEEPEPDPEAPRLSPGVIRLVLGTYLASGFVALAYQVCWTRALIFSFDTLKSTTYSFSGMLLVFLLGLALGSALMQAVVDRQGNLLRLYALIQALIGLSGGFSYFVILQDLPALAEIRPDGSLIYWNAVLNVMLKTAAAIGIPTLLMGMAFPVVTKLAVGSMRHLGIDVARVYALNTVGAILGSFFAGFVLIPWLGITGTIAILAGANLFLSALLFYKDMATPRQPRLAYAVACLVLALFVPVRIGISDTQLQRIQPNENMVHYEEGAMATISVVENNSGDRMIYVDDVGVAGTDKIMLTDQKSLAHMPMMLLGGEANRVLSVGFGSGGASYSYTLYPDIEKIHTIEIAPEVLRAAPALTDSNHGIIVPDEMLQDARASGADWIEGFRHPMEDYKYEPAPGFKTFDPRFKVLIDDARSYLRFADVEYDVIATDCTDLRYKSNANLYDLQYFQLCRERITDDGLVVVWMPLAGLSDRAFRTALHTFQTVFPEMSVWYFTNQPTHYCLLIATKGPLKIDYEEIVEATSMANIQNDLDEIGLRDPAKLISSFVADERTLDELLDPYPLNTEDHPIIEFESPKFGYDTRPLRDNQMGIYDVQVPVSEIVENMPEGMDERLWRLQQANVIVFKGHSAYRLYDFKQACRLYMQALELVPGDSSIERILDFEELIRHFETSKASPTMNTIVIGQGLAEVFYMQGRLEQAVTYAKETISFLPPENLIADSGDSLRRSAFGVYSVAARSYAKYGSENRAREYLEQAAAWGTDEKKIQELREQVDALLEQAEAAS